MEPNFGLKLKKKTWQKVTKLEFYVCTLSLTTILLVKTLRNPLFKRKESTTLMKSSSLSKQINMGGPRNNSITNNPSNKQRAGLPACRSIADAPLRPAKSLQRRSGWCAFTAVHSGMDLPRSASLTLSVRSLVAAAPSTRQQRPPYRKGSSQVRSKSGKKKKEEKTHHWAKSSRHDNHASYRFSCSHYLLMPNMVTLLFPPLLSASQPPAPPYKHTHHHLVL